MGLQLPNKGLNWERVNNRRRGGEIRQSFAGQRTDISFSVHRGIGKGELNISPRFLNKKRRVDKAGGGGETSNTAL